ncbi:MAG: hypothetical protein ACD_26C00167G0002 [uncultured bacterium]|nr:MAG: hypothetical protein ACD_26C00167G0002 [uncultured bacterium]
MVKSRADFMKILITGGAGFIGSHIVDAYIKIGYQVVVVDNLVTGDIKNLNKKAQFYHIDICNAKKLELVFKKVKPQIVNHQAAQISVSSSVNNPMFDAKTNIIGGLNLLKLADKYNVNKFIFASSAAVYGEPQYLPVDENHQCNPQSPYGISKLAFEFYLKAQAKLSGFDYIIFRYGNVYGPRQSVKGEAGVVAIFINHLLNKQKPTIFGNGNKTRDYINVSDIARANLLALTTKNINQTYNLGTGKKTSDLELFKTIFANTNIKPNFVPNRVGDIEHFYYTSQRANKLLNWQAKITLVDGIEETISYYVKIKNTSNQ